jgi:hypothetical protein
VALQTFPTLIKRLKKLQEKTLHHLKRKILFNSEMNLSKQFHAIKKRRII